MIHQFNDIQKVPDLTQATFVPRANTPLLDAIGKGIGDCESCLNRLDEPNRPERVIMVIVTDGQENSSGEFSLATVQGLVKEKSEKERWQFVYLSADLAAMQDAQRLSMPADSSMFYSHSGHGSSSAWRSLSGHSSAFRRGHKDKIGFAPGEREDAAKTKSS